MFTLIFTHCDNEDVSFDCITKAMEYGDSKRMPCAIVSSDDILVKVLLRESWITFH